MISLSVKLRSTIFVGLVNSLFLFPVAASSESVAAGPEIFKAYSAGYTVKRWGFTVAEMSYDLFGPSPVWGVSALYKPKGLASLFNNEISAEESIFLVRKNSLWPSSYAWKPGDEGGVRDVRIKYDLKTDVINYHADGSQNQFIDDRSTFDPLSAQYNLMLAAMQNKVQLDQKLIDDGKLYKQQCNKVTEESVEADNKTNYQSLKYSCKYDTKVVLYWLVPELNYIAVKMQKFEGDSLKLELLLNRVQFE